MSTLERIKAEYEEHLRANWNVDGTRQDGLQGIVKVVWDLWMKEPSESVSSTHTVADLVAMPSPEWESLNRCKQ